MEKSGPLFQKNNRQLIMSTVRQRRRLQISATVCSAVELVPLGKTPILISLLHPQVCASPSQRANETSAWIPELPTLLMWSLHQRPKTVSPGHKVRGKHFSGESHFPNTIPTLSLPPPSPHILWCVCVHIHMRAHTQCASDYLESTKPIFTTSTFPWACGISRTDQSGPSAEIQSKNESSSYQNFKDSGTEGMCPSKHSPVGIQETLTESNWCISASGLVWESLSPNASIEFHPGQKGQGGGKGPGSWQGAHTAQHPSQKQLPAGRLLVPCQPSSQKAGRAKGGILQLADPQLRAEREGVCARGRRRGKEGRGPWEARGQPGDGRSNQSKPPSHMTSLRVHLQQGHPLNRWVLNCFR